MTVSVSGAVVRDDLLHPALDALASNGEQHRLLINLSPEIDSLVEKIADLRRHGVPDDTLRDLLRDCQQIIDLNRGEGDFTRLVTDAADRLASEAERSEKNTGHRSAMTVGPAVRQLAALLRPLLGTLLAGQAADGIAYYRACRQVARVVDQVKPDRLLCMYMRTELGKHKFELLTGLVAEHAESEAA